MKKLLSVLMATIMLLSAMPFCVSAVNDYTVSSDYVVTEQGESFVVPIRLENNKGIMGFKISVQYPDEKLTLTDISSGSLTNDGLFNTTVTSYSAVNGSFDVVWSDTEDVTGDGTLFMLTFTVSKVTVDCKCQIELAYSQEDTFNEDWNDVKLNCIPVEVCIGEPEDVIIPETTEPTTSNQGSDDSTDVSDSFLISSVKAILKSLGFSKLKDLIAKFKETVLEFVNNRMYSYNGNAKTFNTYEELDVAYYKAVSNQAEKMVIDSVDYDVIIENADVVLKEYNAESFAEIPEEKKPEAVDKMLMVLAENNAETQGFNDVETYEAAADVMDSIVRTALVYDGSGIDVTTEKEVDDNNKLSVMIIVTFVVVFAVVSSVVLVLMISKKKKEKVR